MRLIDATPLECHAKEGMGNEWNQRVAPLSWAHAEDHFLSRIVAAPTVDAVAVTRCKDCKHYDMGVCLKIYSDGNVHPAAWQSRNPDDYCSFGERKENSNA